MKTGYEFLRATPSTSFAPLAITPDEIGDASASQAARLADMISAKNQWQQTAGVVLSLEVHCLDFGVAKA